MFSAPRVAVFDLDGVLLRGDSFVTLVRARLRSAPWRVAAPLAVAARSGLDLANAALRGTAVARIGAAVLTGLDEAGYATLAERVGARLARERPMADGLTRVREHLAAGDQVLVVTASEERLARAYLRGVGLLDGGGPLGGVGRFGDANPLGAGRDLGTGGLDVLASTLVVDHRRRWRWAPHNHGAAKLVSLREAGLTAWDLAYSDSSADLPMLRRADRAVLVNPTPGLVERVAGGAAGAAAPGGGATASGANVSGLEVVRWR